MTETLKKHAGLLMHHGLDAQTCPTSEAPIPRLPVHTVPTAANGIPGNDLAGPTRTVVPFPLLLTSLALTLFVINMMLYLLCMM
jgi:hypothetical protein